MVIFSCGQEEAVLVGASQAQHCQPFCGGCSMQDMGPHRPWPFLPECQEHPFPCDSQNVSKNFQIAQGWGRTAKPQNHA